MRRNSRNNFAQVQRSKVITFSQFLLVENELHLSSATKASGFFCLFVRLLASNLWKMIFLFSPIPRNSFIDILRAILLSLEVLIEDQELQINGFILIIDWSNFSFKQASKLTPSILKLAIEGLQVCSTEESVIPWECLELLLFFPFPPQEYCCPVQKQLKNQ